MSRPNKAQSRALFFIVMGYEPVTFYCPGQVDESVMLVVSTTTRQLKRRDFE
ncbi:hypothetical protein [Exiguobacterium sp. SH5S13]|uniref:hypothetical protein n=1 Tax=Exiguobacterium sp. SH5S13 TaxID=2510959 RepID=UPI0013762629|nr:hypothetical protein [Exiguobacterium sp. SH5S13]